MTRWMIAVAAAGVLAASGAAAQNSGSSDKDGPFDGGMRGLAGMRMASPEDRAAFTDARIAALHAGLQLTPDQDKLWPPVEEAIRGMAKMRQDARQARSERFASMREDGKGEEGARDIPGRLRLMADRQAASAGALRKLADASAPLYGSLDEGQKRRLSVLARMMGPRMGHGHHGRHRGWMQRGSLENGTQDFAQDVPRR